MRKNKDGIEVVKPEKEEKNDRVINSFHDWKSIAAIILSAVLIVGVCLFVFFYEKDKEIFNKNVDTSKIELKYTNTNEVISDGIYITDVSKVVEEVMPSIVAITSKTLVSSGNYGFMFGQSQYTEGAGSGIIISKSDNELMILTNNHVVDGASELSVQFINEKSFDAKVKGTSSRKDIAVIAVNLSDLDEDTINSIKIATMGDSNSLKVGNGVIAIGNALGYGQSVTTGVISALNREVTVENYTNKMIQLDAAINGGNSGGALLNSAGEVVGINSVKYSSSSYSSTASIEGMGFAIPISDVTELITDLMNGKEEEASPTIGIEGYIITSAYSKTYNIPIGFYISNITSGSGAEKSELEIGNIIFEIEGEKVDALSDIQNVLSNKKKGDKITLKVYYVSGRKYKEKKVDVTL